jgi:pimeloyl-ACP methyl ester carboxylesterase
MNGELVHVNNHRLYVEAHGPFDGVPVVLLHHGLGAVNAWKGQIRPFADAGYYIIAYDRWGYGRSDPRDHLSLPYFEEDLSDLEVLLDSFNIDQIALIGHSDGGTLSLYFAAQKPARVTCMVIAAAHIYVEPKMIPGIQGVHQVYSHDPRMRAGLQRLHGDKVDSVFQGWYQGWLKPEHHDWDMRPLLSRITCPTLVVQGMEDDHATPQHAQDITAEIPDAELWLEPGVRHMLPQDIPEQFNKRVMRFLENHHVQ